MGIKSVKDTRDGAWIISRNYEEKIPATFILDISEIPALLEGKSIRTIFIDEAQLLEGDVSILTDLSVLYDIDFYIAGLNMTSEQKPYGKITEILSISNNVINVTGSCQDCGRPSVYTYYTLDDKIGDTQIGDRGYISVCPTCLRERRIEKGYPKVLKRTKGN